MSDQTEGRKGSKLARFDLIPPEPLWEVAEIYGRGALKYEERNWERGYAWSLSFAALMRHAWAFWNGESRDEDDGQHHLASVVFHAFALMFFEKHHPDKDDRSEHRDGGSADAGVREPDPGPIPGLESFIAAAYDRQTTPHGLSQSEYFNAVAREAVRTGVITVHDS